MGNTFPNRPRLLKGAFVEYGLKIPPLIVTFQFNPEKITRSRTNTFSAPGGGGEENLRRLQQMDPDLTNIRTAQEVQVKSERISGLELRFDATDKLNEGDFIATQVGIAPQLATLELMMYPKGEDILGVPLADLLGLPGGCSFTGGERPPIILFVWGRKKVLPVNITSMTINEQEFSPDLNPIRAIVTVEVEVIESDREPTYLYSHKMRAAMSVLNLVNMPEVIKTIIP